MAGKVYTYNPENMTEATRDRMRFELGDTMVEGGAETCALCDAEYDAAMAWFPKDWRRAKLALVDSILRRFSYEVNTRVGPLSLDLGERVENWKALRDDLKREILRSSVPIANPAAISRDRYFYEGIMDNREGGGGRHVP